MGVEYTDSELLNLYEHTLREDHAFVPMCERECAAVRAVADRGRAEGYAEAVADVVAWLEAKAERERTHEPRTAVTFARAVAFIGCADLIEDGAHVGAAKKGGS